MTIGDRIKYLREQQGLTQEELAKKLGYKSRSTIYKIESGQREVPRKMIAQLSVALNVSPLDLLGENSSTPISRDDIVEKINTLSDDKIDKLLGYIDALNDK
jgi:repressor LexA